MTRAALAIAALLSVALLWRSPSPRQRSIAVGLAGLAVLDVGRPFVATWPALYVAGFVAFYALTSHAVESTLAPRSPRTGHAFALLACSSGVALRLGMTAELARASFALALAAQALAALRFVSRGALPDPPQRVALILAASSAADVAGPWLVGHASRDWNIGKWPTMLTWLTIAAWEGRCLIVARRPRG